MHIVETIVGNGCTYNTYDNGIHEFLFSAPTREAIDTWIDFGIKLYRESADAYKVYILFDCSRTGTPPLGYAVSRVKVLLAHRPPHLLTQTALVIPQNPINRLAGSLINNILRELDNSEVKFFPPQLRNAAIEWLLKR
jgi:hypothetical protein